MTEALHSPSLNDSAGFNVEDWLTDAALPEESATVYKRADVVAELTDLKRRLEIEGRAADVEQTAGSKRAVTLEREYKRLLTTFSNSALTVYVRALTREEIKDLRAAAEERTKELDPKEANEEFGYDLLAASIIAVKPAGQKRLPAAFTPDKVKAMEQAIGAIQLQLILAARQQAQNGVPTVDADFLHKLSGTEAGQE
jgi:hypothetical protein